MKAYPSHSRGFTYVELAVVIVIVAVIAGMGLVSTLNYVQSGKHVSTQNKMNAIEDALTAFRLKNKRLPCPASYTIEPGQQYYGVEAAATYPVTSLTATSYNCISGTPHANFWWGAYTNGVPAQFAEGAVPVRTLNLPDEYMYDSWGKRFAYSVDAYVTTENAFDTMRPTDLGTITVIDQSHTPRTTGAIYVLFSFGPNGHGSYINNGERQNANANNPDEFLNCHCDVNATVNGTLSYQP